jgi:hypothetical protein
VTFPALLRSIVSVLEADGVSYMLTGSLAAAFHGVPRATQDIDPETGWKIDLIVRKGRPFSREEFNRRVRGKLDDLEVSVVSREDLIIAKLEWAKLEWAKLGGSELQLDDVRTLLDRGEPNLDLEYIERWVEELELGAQ